VSRIYDALSEARIREPGGLRRARRCRAIAVASNKGGVGKTTVATNLAVYLRALREDLPILVLGLDDQPMPQRMFALPGDGTAPDVLDALRRGSLQPAIRLGQYGVHYVPSSPDIAELKRETRDPWILDDALRATDWDGVVLIDTKSDLEILTQAALAASDLALVPVKDHASLLEAERIFALMEGQGLPRDHARVLLSLVDLRVKYGDGSDVRSLLAAEVERRGYPLCGPHLSRSPKVESLHTNPEGRVSSILHAASDSLVHRQFRRLAEDVLRWLDERPPLPDAPRPRPLLGTPTLRWLLGNPRR
jgi:MinD-like ATPase involved in chromosome partitioning or flagellar assembly